MFNNSIIVRCLLIFAAFALLGCAGSPIRTYDHARENNQKMINLKPDMTTTQVTDLMGQPDKTEMYRGKNNEVVLTYLYLTNAGGVNDSVFTPLIFVDDKLAGWGWGALNLESKKFEFVIKER